MLDADPPEKGQLTKRDVVALSISNALAGVAGLILLALFAVNIAQILVRPVFGGWIWVNDLSRLLVTWVIMIGASAAFGLKEHLVVDFLADRLPSRLRTATAFLIRGIEIGIGFILLVSGAVVAMSRMNIQYIQLGIPTGYAYLAVPFLGFFMVLFGLLLRTRGVTHLPAVALEEGDDR